MLCSETPSTDGDENKARTRPTRALSVVMVFIHLFNHTAVVVVVVVVVLVVLVVVAVVVDVVVVLVRCCCRCRYCLPTCNPLLFIRGCVLNGSSLAVRYSVGGSYSCW